MASFTLLQTISSSSSSQEESNRISPTPSSPISFEFPIGKLDQLKENETLKKLKGLWKKVHSSSNYPKEKESLDLHLGLNDEDGSFESCPPPYEEKELYNVYIDSKGESMLEEERQLSKIILNSSSGPSVLSQLFKSETQMLESIERAHDGWKALGLDTRKTLRERGVDGLPPHFMNPPKYGVEEMNKRLGELMGI